MKVAQLGAVAVLLLFPLSAYAQTGTEGSILGTVADSSGAVIPGAAVTVTNTETGVAQKAVTDANGYFQILALPRGVYSVGVQKAGFASWQMQGIVLTAQDNRRVSPVLAVGTTQQEVTVTAGVD